jgi:hypothetical protein
MATFVPVQQLNTHSATGYSNPLATEILSVKASSCAILPVAIFIKRYFFSSFKAFKTVAQAS